jgi:hypothetical protein
VDSELKVSAGERTQKHIFDTVPLSNASFFPATYPAKGYQEGGQYGIDGQMSLTFTP